MTTRNSNAHFDLAPQVSIERSTFDRSTNVKTSFNVGELIPFYVDEVLPGDTFEIETSKVARLQTLITPIMDNLYLDTYYFFVPNRLVWEHWRELCGENTTSPWYPSVQYSVPQLGFPSGGWQVGTIADYMGIPTKKIADGELNAGVNALPFRAYALICNEWFRDENLQQPINIYKGDSFVLGSNGNNQITDIAKGGKPFIANKYHDYFTSCLPSPQKGPDVSFLSGFAPIVTHSNKHDVTYNVPMTWRVTDNNQNIPYEAGLYISPENNGQPSLDAETFYSSNIELEPSSSDRAVSPSNLWADMSKTQVFSQTLEGSPLSINSLRLAFQVQRMYEKDARGGTRYIELLRSHFGVTSPDARLQRPEYLGGNRVPLNIDQVVQNSETNTTPQGNVAGWSQTNDVNYDFSKSFVEHGFIIGLMCARYDHSYQQGLERMWTRKDRFDYYWPALAHLGEQAVYNSEIFAAEDSEPGKLSGVFGYQEAWAEYRYKPNYITGQMRSDYAQSLDIWHFADNYSQAPRLSAEWIREDKTNVDRTLTVKSNVANQIFADIYVKNKCTRAMPLYSIPGLIDHF